MSFLKNIRVKIKLITSYLIIALLLLAVGATGILSLKSISENSNDMYKNKLQSISILSRMETNLTEIKVDMLRLVYVRDTTQKDNIEKDIDSNKTENDKFTSDYDKLNINNANKQTWSKFKE